MIQDVRVGVVGCGYWGPNLVRAFSELPEVSVDVVADLDDMALARLRSRNPRVGSFTTDIDSVFELGLDAIVIATPADTHHELASRALSSGLDVFVEKPLATSTEDSVDLVARAQQNDRVLMVGHIVEYNPAVIALQEMISSGELGDIRYLDGVRAGLGLFDPKSNVLWDLGPHEISMFTLLLGALPEKVSARGISCVQDGVADVVYLTLQYPDGVLAHSRLSWLDPHKTRRVSVVGSHKMAVYDDLASQEKLRIFDKRVDRIRPTDTFGEFQFAYHYGSVVSPHLELHEPLAVECRQFVNSVKSRETPRTDGLNGLNVVRVLEAAQASLDRFGEDRALAPVSLDEEGASSSQLLRSVGGISG